MLKLGFFGSMAAAAALFGVLATAEAPPNQPPQDPAAKRRQAAKLQAEGNVAEALALFRELTLAPGDGKTPAEDLHHALECLDRLGRIEERDDLVENAVAAHPTNPYLLREAALAYRDAQHWGNLIAGKFSRGDRQGGGEFVQSADRDRVRALQLILKAIDNLRTAGDGKQAAAFHLDLADLLKNGRDDGGAWRLQEKTDLTKLPDYEQAGRRFRWGGFGTASEAGVPVDEKGDPVYYAVPASFDAANDGERWRWALEQARKLDPSRRPAIDLTFADFLRSQFDVVTLRSWAGWPRIAGDDENGKPNDAGPYAVHTLADDETIAKLATGVKRFTLPAEFSFVRLYKSVAERKDASREDADTLRAIEALAQLYEDRRQYPKAAEWWQTAVNRFGPGQNNERKDRLNQIAGNWLRFENVELQPAGKPATVVFRYRNGNKVSFKAQAVRFGQLIADVQAYLRSNPQQIDWQKSNLHDIGHRLVAANETKYLGETVAAWDTNLDRPADHFDAQTDVETPLSKPGVYLLTARIAGGNTARVIVWLTDTAIVRKPTDGANLYYVADATTGTPVPGATIEFFGWQNRVFGNARPVTLTSQLTSATDANGFVAPTKQEMPPNYQWLAVARTKDGRFAHLGFDAVWYADRNENTYRQNKAYLVTDRPVYRPKQPVRFKLWVRRADYGDNDKASPFAGDDFTARITDPRGQTVLERKFTADEYGGFGGTYDLPEQASLGQYTVQILDAPNVNGALAGTSPFMPASSPANVGTFRVEEYKKPEFEVTIDAPAEPVLLGEPIKAKIAAKYYFGSPVTNAKVHYKVTRTKHETHWYPAGRWDWFYGRGYGWFGGDYAWYPGFARWGCMPPLPPWNWAPPEPPEIVAESEVPIGEDGTVEVTIDTAVAKELFGDSDHRYEITAEVTDASRRTITGTGSVLAPREPFRVFAWVDRGFYRVGDPVVAHFKAQTAAEKPVTGETKVALYRVTYDENGKPTETPVEGGKSENSGPGETTIRLRAGEAGQYRVACTVTDAAGHAIEGGYLFSVLPDRDAPARPDKFRYNDLELTSDKQEYAPGETAKLLVAADRSDATVLLFVRPENGQYPRPQIVRPNGKTQVVEVPLRAKDMPNVFVEAVTISDGRVHTAVRQLYVPPESRVTEVELLPSKTEYKPGEAATVQVKLKDAQGKPVAGAVAVTMYDRSVEYISGGSNVPDIREFFWKWQRDHQPQSFDNLSRVFGNLLKPNEPYMGNLGAFGDIVPTALTKSLRVRAQAPGGGLFFSEEPREGAMGGFGGGLPMPAAAPAALMASDSSAKSAPTSEAGGPPLAEAAIRTNFADTAFWEANRIADENGVVELSLTMPENLTAWKLRAWAVGDGTRVGEASTEVVTRKNLLVRMQAPRFFTETDEVVLSANVHNHLESDKQARVSLELEGETLAHLNEPARTVTVPAGGETRVDWRVRAANPGEAIVTMKALTDEESDAMRQSFPVHIHGMLRTESYTGAIKPGDSEATVKFTVPDKRRINDSLVEIRFSPSLAAAMVDALPYLSGYPYGCTEQTLNRFLPTVITQNVLKQTGVKLEEIRDKRTNLNPQEVGAAQTRAAAWGRVPRGSEEKNPVWDVAEVAKRADAGLARLMEMRSPDGGWGWFPGAGSSNPHITALVVHGLTVGKANGLNVPDDVIAEGLEWLKNYQQREIAELKNGDTRGDKKPEPYKTAADNLDAFVFLVLTESGTTDAEMDAYLYRDRTKLSLYAAAMYGLALTHLTPDSEGARDRLDMVLRNLKQFVVEDNENGTAYLRLPNEGYWWFWYGSETEANAYYLKLLAKTDPKGDLAPKLVKYLLNNRKHATYWDSTRDTAIAIEAMADYLAASGEDQPDLTVEVLYDGEKRHEVKITSENLFSFDNAVTVVGDAVEAGEHTVTLRKTGTGPLYWNAYVTVFTQEDLIPAAGLEIKVDRKTYKLTRQADAAATRRGSRGQAVEGAVEAYDRTELKNGDALASGDLVEVELMIDSKNDYEYLAFEDMKAAGFEPVEVRSGYTGNALGAYMELRDERAAFFVERLPRGTHSVKYRLRAEIPGSFSALPARGYAMYAPELRGNSNELKLRITEE